MARYGEENGNTKRNVFVVMFLVVLVGFCIFVLPMLTQKPASAPVDANAGMPVPVAPPSASPSKNSKDAKSAATKKVSLMTCPLTGKNDGDCPMSPG